MENCRYSFAGLGPMNVVHSDDSMSVCLYVGGKDDALQEFLFLLLVPLIKNIREDSLPGLLNARHGSCKAWHEADTA